MVSEYLLSTLLTIANLGNTDPFNAAAVSITPSVMLLLDSFFNIRTPIHELLTRPAIQKTVRDCKEFFLNHAIHDAVEMKALLAVGSSWIWMNQIGEKRDVRSLQYGQEAVRGLQQRLNLRNHIDVEMI